MLFLPSGNYTFNQTGCQKWNHSVFSFSFELFSYFLILDRKTQLRSHNVSSQKWAIRSPPPAPLQMSFLCQNQQIEEGTTDLTGQMILCCSTFPYGGGMREVWICLSDYSDRHLKELWLRPKQVATVNLFKSLTSTKRATRKENILIYSISQLFLLKSGEINQKIKKSATSQTALRFSRQFCFCKNKIVLNNQPLILN